MLGTAVGSGEGVGTKINGTRPISSRSKQLDLSVAGERGTTQAGWKKFVNCLLWASAVNSSVFPSSLSQCVLQLLFPSSNSVACALAKKSSEGILKENSFTKQASGAVDGIALHWIEMVV